MPEQVFVKSEVKPLKEIFSEKFDVDFYQREYVWEQKHVDDLITDLSNEFLKHWRVGDDFAAVSGYAPYFMGEIVLSTGTGRSSIIDGQQRITTLTLLLIYLLRRFRDLPGFPKNDVEHLICSDYYGQNLYNLDIPERRDCMDSLYQKGEYTPKPSDMPSVQNIVDRFNDFDGCWNSGITDENVVHFTYWIKEKVVFSRVWTNSDEFAYVIFETMNDRGLSLTQVEMLRGYLLANVNGANREKAMKLYDASVARLVNIKLTSKSKAEFEFFKMYLRGHYAQDFSQAKNSNSDFVRIGKEFHRWVRDNEAKLDLTSQGAFLDFIERIDYFSGIYERICSKLAERNVSKYFYLIVNGDYGFTLQPALILASINYRDTEEEIDRKIQIVSRYLTKILSWRVWNQTMIAQSSMEATIYELCCKVRGLDSQTLKDYLDSLLNSDDELQAAPILNQQNNRKFRVLLSLITEIVARESGQSDYMLNKECPVEVEHIWANHFDRHIGEFSSEQEFSTARNTIGDLLVLPKSFNASYGDLTYEDKVKQYFSQNILAQSLHPGKYVSNPGFVQFIARSGLKFKAYESFDKLSIAERTELYKSILVWNWSHEESV